VVPLDIVPAREARLVARHLTRIRETFPCDVYVVVTETEHAENLISLAQEMLEDLMQIVIDGSLCASRDDLVEIMDASPLAHAIAEISLPLDTPRLPEPSRPPSSPDDFPVPADKMDEPAHDAGNSSLDTDFEFDFLPDEPDPAAAPGRRRMPHQPSTSTRIVADELDHEDDPNVDQRMKRAHADDPDDHEDDPDPLEPGVIDEDRNPDR
ncbi:MAG: hypothetical protein JJU40_16585, partial [Rhodobacteraceae bacterium]|nr:hypothetical protein [Paracoccaceae bacterium]